MTVQILFFLTQISVCFFKHVLLMCLVRDVSAARPLSARVSATFILEDSAICCTSLGWFSLLSSLKQFHQLLDLEGSIIDRLIINENNHYRSIRQLLGPATTAHGWCYCNLRVGGGGQEELGSWSPVTHPTKQELRSDPFICMMFISGPQTREFKRWI